MSTGEHPPTVVSFGEDLLERMVLAVEKVRERLRRAAGALDAAGIPYAVIGGNAVAAWVSKVDAGAARNTVDVDLLVNRADFDGVKAALERVGFVYNDVLGVQAFLDGPGGSPRDAVHVTFAGEKIRPGHTVPAPDLSTVERQEAFTMLGLEQLVTMKLTSYRLKDRVHLLDMIGVGLLDDKWPGRLPAELAARLQELLDNPDG